ncbi:hypothetical protein BCR44DRAFT_1431828 [Catenaria anguillulae PL171]|uniref:Uncharacterized protein n=1 Tax=Catenaria anguillulae PL171 TaxID=765915 RepID=A0A1Y2HQD5_9FUNG|nr:hypothetical protein BCR44DRAFT_1431828 [Catenaria anguillulae PL171]
MCKRARTRRGVRNQLKMGGSKTKMCCILLTNVCQVATFAFFRCRSSYSRRVATQLLQTGDLSKYKRVEDCKRITRRTPGNSIPAIRATTKAGPWSSHRCSRGLRLHNSYTLCVLALVLCDNRAARRELVNPLGHGVAHEPDCGKTEKGRVRIDDVQRARHGELAELRVRQLERFPKGLRERLHWSANGDQSNSNASAMAAWKMRTKAWNDFEERAPGHLT